jgi:transposase
LQPGAETAESTLVGSQWILAESSYPKGTQRLEQDKFPWPQDEEAVRELTAEQLQMLLTGIDFFKAHRT